MRQEIKALASSPSFGPFQPPAEAAEFGSPSQIKGCGDTIQVLTPRWLELLDAAATERVSSEASVPQRIQPAGRHTLILGLLCHKMRPNKSTNIQTVLGLDLYQGGARRRVIDTTYRFGFTMSYTTIQRRLADLSEEAARMVKVLGYIPDSIATYDNFDFARRLSLLL